MAKQAKTANMIKVVHKDGRISHFNKVPFLKGKADAQGWRGGWKPFEGEDQSIEGTPMALSSNTENVPNELKTFTPEAKGVSEEEVQKRIAAAVEKDRAARTRRGEMNVEPKGVSEEPTQKINSDNTINETSKQEAPANTTDKLPDTTNSNSPKAEELKEVKARVERNDPTGAKSPQPTKNQGRNS